MADIQKTLPHSGDSVADIWKPESTAEAELVGHETIEHHKARANPRPGETDAELLRDEGADLPHDTVAGRVHLKGAE